MPKYKLTLNHLEKQGDIRKLERDGFTRADIHNTLYRETEGSTTAKRTEIITKLYDRRK